MLEATNIQKTFITGQEVLPVLKGVNLVIGDGEIISIVGASGAGKSTLLHILGALDRPTAGEILLDSVSFTRLSPEQTADFRNRTIGFVFQFHHLLPEFTALENVMMPALIARETRPAAREKAQRILAEVGLGERLEHKPGELSGGEQQRVAVARALVNQPKVLLCDEPTGNLDSASSEQLHELLWGLHRHRGMSIVIVTHDESLANRTHAKYRLADGILHKG